MRGKNPYLCAKIQKVVMASKHLKSILVASFIIFFSAFSFKAIAQEHAEGHEEKTEKLDPAKIILEHIADAHEFHFFSVGDFHATLPLPVIVYAPEKGLSVFSSSRFQHGHAAYNGYIIATDLCA